MTPDGINVQLTAVRERHDGCRFVSASKRSVGRAEVWDGGIECHKRCSFQLSEASEQVGKLNRRTSLYPLLETSYATIEPSSGRKKHKVTMGRGSRSPEGCPVNRLGCLKERRRLWLRRYRRYGQYTDEPWKEMTWDVGCSHRPGFQFRESIYRTIHRVMSVSNIEGPRFHSMMHRIKTEEYPAKRIINS